SGRPSHAPSLEQEREENKRPREGWPDPLTGTAHPAPRRSRHQQPNRPGQAPEGPWHSAGGPISSGGEPAAVGAGAGGEGAAEDRGRSAGKERRGAYNGLNLRRW